MNSISSQKFNNTCLVYNGVQQTVQNLLGSHTFSHDLANWHKQVKLHLMTSSDKMILSLSKTGLIWLAKLVRVVKVVRDN